jgi:hypothetical protein
MIRAVSLLYQRQRTAGPLVYGSVINATFQDYVVARKLLSDPMGRSLGGALPDAVARFGHRLIDRYGSDQFSSTDACRDDSVLTSKGKVNEYLQTLQSNGVVDCVEPNKGPKPAVWRVVGPVPAGGSQWLPTLAELEACV